MIYEHEFVCNRCGWKVYAPVHHGLPGVCADCQYCLQWRAHDVAAETAPSQSADRWPNERCLRWGIGIFVVLWALLIGLVMAMVAHL